MIRIAIVESGDLLGRELRESLGEVRELWSDCLLMSAADDQVGTLAEVGGEATVVQLFDPEELASTELVFLCGDAESGRAARAQLPEGVSSILMAADAELEDGLPLVAGVNLEQAARGRALASPHPGVVALAHLLHPLRSFGLEKVSATLLLPASMHGQAALDEVFSQTRDILAFAGQSEPKSFPAQMAFNLLPSELPAGLLVGPLRWIVGGEPTISLQLLQAGVFHGVGVSLQVELASEPGTAELRDALGEHPMNELAEEPERLGPIATANRPEVLVGAVDEDLRPGSYRIWAVMDNLTRGGALNAIGILEALAGGVTH